MDAPVSADERPKAYSLRLGAGRKVQELSDRRHHVNGPHLIVHNFARGNFRPRHDERHVQGRIIKKHAVGHFPVLAEALPVIANHHDERAAV